MKISMTDAKHDSAAMVAHHDFTCSARIRNAGFYWVSSRNGRSTPPSFIEAFPNMLGREYCRLIIDRFEADDRRHASTVGRSVKREDPARTGTILFLDDTMDDWQDVVIQTHAAVTKAVTEYTKGFPALAEHLSSGHVGCRYPRIERVNPG